jgi:hypothetical protein
LRRRHCGGDIGDENIMELECRGKPPRPFTTPEEVARLIAVAASPNNITGAEYPTDGGIVKNV